MENPVRDHSDRTRGHPAKFFMNQSTPPQVHHEDESASYPTSERCEILEYWNRPDDPEVSIARATVAVGVTTRVHRLAGTTERYLILQGEGSVRIGTLPATTVAPGDVVFIPPDCDQSIRNTGNIPLVFLAICTPRFRPEVYVFVGD